MRISTRRISRKNQSYDTLPQRRRSMNCLKQQVENTSIVSCCGASLARDKAIGNWLRTCLPNKG